MKILIKYFVVLPIVAFIAVATKYQDSNYDNFWKTYGIALVVAAVIWLIFSLAEKLLYF